ncbi:MAG: Osmosensitive channel histidine kinase KdpD [Labilithrix sp.]|nr:Osmosensitive channel histidine kinase KdpD [Labilithrix sp.]
MRSGSAPATEAKKRAPRKPKKPKGKDPLLSAICHDLRAPLAAVTMGANYVLQSTQRLDENARSVKILEAMLRSCTQMERLIRNFADLSEIEGDAVTLRLGLQDAGELLHVVSEQFGDAARARQVALEVLAPAPAVALRCDRERLVRAIGQLVDNAVKLSPAGSAVTLSAADRETSVAISITDRGPGLTPQVRRNLFDRQFHAKRANRVGAGFGLAVARGFATAHGGKLVIDARPEEPTTFTLLLPKDGPKGYPEDVPRSRG